MTQMILYLREMYDNFKLPMLTALYLVFEKAIDKVGHEKIMEKLQNNGVATLDYENRGQTRA